MILVCETVKVMIQAFQGTQSYRLTSADAEQQGNIRSLPATVGHCLSRFNPVAECFNVVCSNYQPVRPLREEPCNPHDRPMLVLTFGLAGNSQFCGRDGSETQFTEGQLTVTSFHGSQGERRYLAGEQVGQLRLLLSAECATRYLGQAVSNRLFATGLVVNHAFTPYSRVTTLLLERLQQQGDDALMLQINALNLLANHRHL